MLTWKRYDGSRENTGFLKATAVRAWEDPTLSVISVGIYDRYMGEEGFRLSIHRKDSGGFGWYACNLPDELLPELIQFLMEYRESIRGK